MTGSPLVSALLPYLVFAVILAGIVGFFAWLAAVVRRRGLAGAALRGALAAHDEAFHVTAHESAYEIQAQAERKLPVRRPGGKPVGHGGESVGLGGTSGAKPGFRRKRKTRKGPAGRV